MAKQITLSHGNGGAESQELIGGLIFSYLGNETLLKGEDAAVVEDGTLAVTTDSFTVSPLFFKGGDIGKLSVCGTCNDLAMMGAKPHYLTLSMIIEEGFSLRNLERILHSIKVETELNGAKVVCGDTKVVPKGSADAIFINTTGIGVVKRRGISAGAIKEGDTIIVSGDIGRHGAAIFTEREGIDLQSDIESDCASLWPMVDILLKAGIDIHSMRDATRGGVAAVLNEWVQKSDICIGVEESAIPICESVEGVCEILGLDATVLANEGTFLVAVPSSDAQKCLELFKENGFTDASAIAVVTKEYPGRVVLKSAMGTKRFMDMPTGEILPRIC